MESTEVMVTEIIKSKDLPQSTATMLRGKVQYAEGQLFNRVAAIMMPEVRARASGKSPGTWLNQEAEQELHWAMSFFRNAPPRKLLAYDTRPPLRIFTDAAQEGARDEIATIGAVMFDQDEIEMFGLKLSPKQLSSLQIDSTRIITSLEALPVAASIVQWRERLMHRRVFIYVDNDAARAGLIKMFSDVPSIRRVQLRLIDALNVTPCFPWYARVPSKSNVADNASRLVKLEIFDKEAIRVHPNIDEFFMEAKGEARQAQMRKKKGSSGQGSRDN